MATSAGDLSDPLLVINPRASRMRDHDRRRAIVEVVAKAVHERTGREPRVLDDTQDAATAALEAVTTPPLVVAIGGDGTIRHAAGILAGRSIPMAIVPAGTGNVLAASLGIRGLRSALAAIRDGAPRTIDLGRAAWGRPGATAPDGQDVFVVAAGVGLDARIMAAAHEEWKRRLQFGAYVGATLRELTRLASADFVITADGETIERHGHLVLVANAGQIIPGRLSPREPIDPTDGFLDLIVVGGRGIATGLRSAAELLFRAGELTGTAVRRRVREARIETDPPEPVETDGDVHGPGWLDARIEPGAVTMLVPPRSATA
jgi:diacylglycerol kinase family enzyme